MKIFATFVITLLLLAFPAAAAPGCGVRVLDACANTNQLIWAKDVQAAIRKFLQHEPGNFLYDRPKVGAADDAIDLLGGPPDDPKRLQGDLRFFTACRAHSCDEKGAIIFKPDGKILAVGIVHYCGAPGAERACEMDAVLTLFLATDAPRARIVGMVTDWARTQVAAVYTPKGLHKPKLADVDVVQIKN